MFARPAWLAAALPALAAAWGLARLAGARRAAVLRALGRPETVSRSLAGPSGARGARLGLRLAGLALLFAALAGPRWGVELLEARSSARHVVVAVDVSLSMLAQDAKPSRLERAKASLSLLLDELRGERVGVVAFAGKAQVICPVTADVEAAKQLLSGLEPGAVAEPGTAVGEAVRAAAAMLGPYPGGKSVVLLTDGEDHRSDPLGAAREAARSGVRVHAVGIGTPEGEPIPLGAPGSYKTDAKGTPVLTRLGEKTLAAVAEATGGVYRRATPGADEIGDIVARIKAEEAARGLGASSRRWRDRYRWPLAAAFALLLAELLAPLAARRPAAAAAAALLLAAAPPARAGGAEARLREGNRLYRRGNFEEALSRYGDAAARRPGDSRAPFNAGDALYRLDRHPDAAAAFEKAAGGGPAPRRAAALYNLGNARFRSGDFAGAAEAYRRSLALAPGDEDARHNLALAAARLKNPPAPKPGGAGGGQEPPKPDDGRQKSGDSSAGGREPQPSRPRPQGGLDREEAERVLRASADREKDAGEAARARAAARPRAAAGGEDW